MRCLKTAYLLDGQSTEKDMNLFLLISEPKIYSFYNNLYGFILYSSDDVQNAIEMSGNDQIPADSVHLA
jgi:hypothetical protein